MRVSDVLLQLGAKDTLLLLNAALPHSSMHTCKMFTRLIAGDWRTMDRRGCYGCICAELRQHSQRRVARPQLADAEGVLRDGGDAGAAAEQQAAEEFRAGRGPGAELLAAVRAALSDDLNTPQAGCATTLPSDGQHVQANGCLQLLRLGRLHTIGCSSRTSSRCPRRCRFIRDAKIR